MAITLFEFKHSITTCTSTATTTITTTSNNNNNNIKEVSSLVYM